MRGICMKKKAISIWLATILIVSIFTVIIAGTTTAINNDHNLSGLVWKSDGTAPASNTTFAIYVYHNSAWERFPQTGWIVTERGTTDNRYWYSFVLPNEEYLARWQDGDLYKVHVDGTPWGEFNGNTTSNGTGSAGDPFPTPYNPTNPANSENEINYSAGGGLLNEQQWDVRTVAPVDLAPTNVTSDGRDPALYPGGFPADPNLDIPFTFNVTNFGSVESGDFYVSIWNCTVDGDNLPGGINIIDEIFITSIPGGGDSGMITREWFSKDEPGEYYVNITVDSREEITEFDESNNRVILHFTVGPELIITEAYVNGQFPIDPVSVARNRPVQISAKVKNNGSSGTGSSFTVTIYNLTGPNGSRVPGSEIHVTHPALGSKEESGFITWIWIAPSNIFDEAWINITVDFYDDVWEANESNNNYMIHFFVPNAPVTVINATHFYAQGFVWYIDSTAQLWFFTEGDNPPLYTWYTVFDYANGNDDKPEANFTLEGTNFQLTYGQKTYDIEYYSFDSIPNIEPDNHKIIIVDDEDPVTSLSVSGPRYREADVDNWNITSATPLTLTAMDDPQGESSYPGFRNASGIDEIWYHITNASGVVKGWTQANILIEVDGLYTAESFRLDNASWYDGLYTIEYYSIDNLGHSNITGSTTLYLDNTAPVKSIGYGEPQHLDVPSDVLFINSQTPITLGANDGTGSGVNRTEYRVWGSTFDTGWVTYTSAITVSSSWDDGIYTIEYNSTDNLGNDDTESDTFYLDNDGPVSEFVGYSNLNVRYDVDPYTTNFTFDADDFAGSGVDEIHYRRDSESSYQVFNGSGTFIDLFNPDVEDIPWNHTIYLKSFDNLGNEGPEITLLIFIEGDITPPLPPVLRAYKDGDNIRLQWDYEPPTSEPDDLDHYLIYRSTTKNGFDFGDIWVNTAVQPAANPVPLTTSWIDTDASSSDEYYYTIRSVDDRNNAGYTSNIVGKVTLTFEKGYNTFSLPLRPHDGVSTTGAQILAEDDFADKSDTVYRYDAATQQWIGRAKDMPGLMDDFTLTFGQGYMIYIAESSIDYTFTGEAGIAIRFMGNVVGDDPDFRDSLTVARVSNGLKLSWSSTADADGGYHIYRRINRLGADSLNDFSGTFAAAAIGTDWTDTGATSAQFEYYYLVVAVDGHEVEGASTYAVGVKKVAFSDGYSLISPELEPKTTRGLGSLANEMFSRNTDTLYYYDRSSESWQGHPDILPENINNVNIDTGKAYIVYVDAEDVSYVFTGV
jgi:hypothetical protein